MSHASGSLPHIGFAPINNSTNEKSGERGRAQRAHVNEGYRASPLRRGGGVEAGETQEEYIEAIAVVQSFFFFGKKKEECASVPYIS